MCRAARQPASCAPWPPVPGAAYIPRMNNDRQAMPRDAADGDLDRRLAEQAERHLTTAASLRRTAWELAAAGLRTFRPELAEAEVQDEVRTLFRRAAG